MRVEELELGELEKLFVDELGLYRTANTIQLLVLRQTHDYTIFRTEETRELNVVTLPTSSKDSKPALKVAMLASKQKAAESRHYLTVLRSAAGGENLDEAQKKCTLKDALCQRCPRCVLFGAVSTAGGRGERWNIKHRVEYSTAYSIEPYDQISELMTFNAVDAVSQSTGQALGFTENVSPLANFPSVITLNSITKAEFVAFVKCLLACKSYGAETRTKGDMVNHLLGVVGGHEEVITPLEFCLEASANESFLSDPVKSTSEIVEKFSKYAMFADALVYREGDELSEKVRDVAMDGEFAKSLYGDAEAFSKKLAEYSK
ncbi:MAG: type I-D CRISPR-associated protein Cas7/Csc2 [Methermicoccaceae archaeon]